MCAKKFLYLLIIVLLSSRGPIGLQITADSLEQSLSESEEAYVKHVHEESKFYKKYLDKYYPRVFVIQEHYFEKMSPEQIADAIGVVVHIFSEKPWFYFFDKAKGFKLAAYWEYVIDQCSYISDFLKKARVVVDTKQVYIPESEGKSSSFGDTRAVTNKPITKTKNLFLYLRDSGYTEVYDFYALSFDFLIKLFNEGILLKDFVMVDRYYYELDFVVKKLFKSKYEADYLEVMKTCKELMALLRTKNRQDQEDFLYDDLGRTDNKAIK